MANAFRWEFDRGRPARKLLRKNIRDFKDLRWFWKKVMPDIVSAHKRHWNTEGSDKQTGYGSGWVPLADLTVQLRNKRRGYYARGSREGAEHRILHWTGSLRNSFASQHGTQHSVRRIFRKRIEYGSKHPVAHDQEYGGESSVGTSIPRRHLLAEDQSLEAIAKSAKRIIHRRLGA